MWSFRAFLTEHGLLLENKIKFFAQRDKMPEEHVQTLADIDPNPKKKNLGWLVNQHKSGEIAKGENGKPFHQDDLDRHATVLRRMEAMKIAHPKSAAYIGDIMQIKNAAHLHDKMNEWDANHGPQAHEKKWGEKVFDRNGHSIYHLTTSTHCENHGEGSEWCTRIKDGVHQGHYLKHGNLYVHYPPDSVKPEEKGHAEDDGRYQFWIPNNGNDPELQDHGNRSINPEEHEENYPKLAESHHWGEFKDAANPVKKLAHGTTDDKIEAIMNHGAHYDPEGEHLWDQGEHEDVHKAILDYSYASGDPYHIRGTEEHFRQFNHSELHFHMATKTPLADTARYIHDHAKEHGDWDSLDELSKNTKWQSKQHGENSEEDHAHVARGLAQHEDDGIRSNIIKSSNKNTFIHAAHGFIDHAKDNYHKDDFFNSSKTYERMGAKLNLMRSKGYEEEANAVFQKMHNHPVEEVRAEYVKHNLSDARANIHLTSDQSPSVRDAFKWDDPDYLHTKGDSARVQAARIGNDKHHAILMHDPVPSVRSATFKAGSIATKVAMHSHWDDQPLETRQVIRDYPQKMSENERHEFAHALVATGQRHNIMTAIEVGNDDIHRNMMTHPDPNVRHKVLRNSSNKEILGHIANNDPSDNLRSLAKSRLSMYHGE